MLKFQETQERNERCFWSSANLKIMSSILCFHDVNLYLMKKPKRSREKELMSLRSRISPFALVYLLVFAKSRAVTLVSLNQWNEIADDMPIFAWYSSCIEKFTWVQLVGEVSQSVSRTPIKTESILSTYLHTHKEEREDTINLVINRHC